MTWPETRVLSADDVAAGPAHVREKVAEAAALSQRLRLSCPFRFGSDVCADLAMLELLTQATARFVSLDWELAAEPPWPLRSLVHLSPPSNGIESDGTEFARSWREAFRFGLCTYRLGPGFAIIRDQRPDGQRLRVQLTGPWAASLDRLATDAAGPRGAADDELLGRLAAIGLAMRIGTAHYVAPFRLRRWPIHFTSA